MRWDSFWNGFGSKKEDRKQQTIAANTVVEEQDGAIVVEGGFGYYGQAFVGWDGSPTKTEADQISKYRNLLLIPEVDYAVDDITNEAISTDTTDVSVEVILDDVEVSDKIKKRIVEEFETVLSLMKFSVRGYEYFKDFYVDGRVAFHKIIDSSKPKQGLIAVKQFEAICLTKVREVNRDGDGIIKDFREYFVYDETLLPFHSRRSRFNGKKVEIPKDSVTFVISGDVDVRTGMVIGPLHKAVKWANNLTMLEDATVVYRYSRAPEKRMFYIDTGNLPPTKAEAFVTKIMNKFKNKIVYDPMTGGVKDQKNLLSMYEDFWLPRSATGRGTEVTTLQGGQNLGEIDDILYFRKKLYQALNIPTSRVEQDGVIQFGKLAEITRDELKFSKFVGRLRKRFSEVFTDILGTQLILKGVLTEDEWLNINGDVRYDFVQDAYIARQKENELLQSKVDIMRDLESYIGKFISYKWTAKNVWRMSDEEIEEMKKEIIEERSDEVYGQPMNDEGGDFGGGQTPPDNNFGQGSKQQDNNQDTEEED